jgi:hypothetical protein
MGEGLASAKENPAQRDAKSPDGPGDASHFAGLLDEMRDSLREQQLAGRIAAKPPAQLN